MIMMLDAGMSVDPKLIGSRETLSRKKRRDRQKVAFSRVRVDGLFVSKKKELQLQDQEQTYVNNGDESETCEPPEDTHDNRFA